MNDCKEPTLHLMTKCNKGRYQTSDTDDGDRDVSSNVRNF
jgi:hypothetical protein